MARKRGGRPTVQVGAVSRSACTNGILVCNKVTCQYSSFNFEASMAKFGFEIVLQSYGNCVGYAKELVVVLKILKLPG